MLVIVGCGKRKLGCVCKARDMYTGSLFRSHMELARRLPARGIVIISAEHGLLELDDEIEPYETTIRDLDKGQRAAWEAGIAAKVEQATDAKELVLVLAGASYLSWSKLCARRVVAPLAGMMLGERRAVVRAFTLSREEAYSMDEDGADELSIEELADEMPDELRVGGVSPAPELLVEYEVSAPPTKAQGQLVLGGS